MRDYVSEVSQFVGGFNVPPPKTFSANGTAQLVLPANPMRWGFMLSTSASSGFFWGVNATVVGNVGIPTNSQGNCPLIITQDIFPGLPNQTIYCTAMLGAIFSVMETIVVPSGEGIVQSPATALRRLQAMGIVDDSGNRLGPVASPEAHIMATRSPLQSLPTLANTITGVNADGKPISRQAKINARGQSSQRGFIGRPIPPRGR